MYNILTCCCLSCYHSNEERQPVLQSRSFESTTAESARQNRPARTGTQSQTGRLAIRRVGVPELDKRFADVAETFTKQQEHYESMVQHIFTLRQTYGCNHDNTLFLTECVKKIRDDHGSRYTASLQMKGYDFSLSVVPLGLEGEEEYMFPASLQIAQDALNAVSLDAKATISVGTKLQEMIGWLQRSEEQMAKQVKEAAPSYQEQGRLAENLRESLKEVRRAKELSRRYKQQAGEVHTEAAQIAGAEL